MLPLFAPGARQGGAGFDLSDAVYANKRYLVSQTSSLLGVNLNGSGTAALLTANPDGCYEYTLSAANDISSASYAGKNQSVGGSATHWRFRDDGLKLYGNSSNDRGIYQFDVVSAWDMGSPLGSSVFFDASAQFTAGTMAGIWFGDSGAKMYLCHTNDTIYQYNLGTPWSVTTASYASLSKDVTGETTGLREIVMNETGTKMLVLSSTTLYQYTLSTPWKIDTASYDSVSFSLTTQISQAGGMFIQGDNLYVTDDANSGGNYIYQYKL